MMDYGRLQWNFYMATSDGCQWVRRTMTALLLSFTAAERTEGVLHEISEKTDAICHVMAKL